MKKRMFSLLLLCALLLSACGAPGPSLPAGGPAAETPEPDPAAETPGSDPAAVPTHEAVPAESDSLSIPAALPGPDFSQLEGLVFYFSSGVGAWHTELSIQPDGSFSGVHSDSDMGDIGDGYPNGTYYYCEFSGRFTQPEPLDENSWRFTIESIQTDSPTEERIEDGMRVIPSSPYGLDGAGELVLYLPGTPVSSLPEEFLGWVHSAIPSDGPEAEVLPFYGLFNVNEGYGFSSYPSDEASGAQPESTAAPLSDAAQALVDAAEAEAASLERRLTEDPDLSQADMNELSGEIYTVWDDALNRVWALLQEQLDPEAMAALTEEERAWIKEKEAAVQAAADEAQGGSLSPLLANSAASDMTRDRVYVLAALLN